MDGAVYILDIKSNEWRVPPSGQVYREGHSALYIGDDTILIYGGVPEDAYNRHYNHSQLLKYKVKENVWESIEAQGPAIPETRSRHAACLSEDKTKMFVSGGLYKDEMNDPYDDLRVFDLKTGVWEGSRKFIRRFDHFITHYDGKIWALGGLTKDMAHVTEISWFDLQTNITGSIKIHHLPKIDGDHIFVRNGSQSSSSFLLDVVIPLYSAHTPLEPCIGLYDLNNLRWHAALSGAFQPLLGHKWKHTFIHESNLYLLGYPVVDGSDDAPFDFNLNTIISLDLADLGIMERENRKRKHSDDSMSSEFGSLLANEEFTDFEIIGIEGNERPSLNSKFIERNEVQLDAPFQETHNDTFVKSNPLKVHTTILLARWPHFKRIITSGMQETKTNTLFIPEPIEWLKALMEYLYTNDLSKGTLELYSGLLILSNLYEVPKLRKFCLNQIYLKGFTAQGAIKIWSRARLINEEVLAHNAANYCSKNWKIVIRTRAFEELAKEEIIDFCRMITIGQTNSSALYIASGATGEDGFNLNNYDRDYSTTMSQSNSFGHYDTAPNFGLPERQNVLINPDDNEPKDDEIYYNVPPGLEHAVGFGVPGMTSFRRLS